MWTNLSSLTIGAYGEAASAVGTAPKAWKEFHPKVNAIWVRQFMQDVLYTLYERQDHVREFLDDYFEEILDSLNKGQRLRPTIPESVALLSTLRG